MNACRSGGGCPGRGSGVRAPGSPEADFQKAMANSSKVTEMSGRASVALAISEWPRGSWAWWGPGDYSR